MGVWSSLIGNIMDVNSKSKNFDYSKFKMKSGAGEIKRQPLGTKKNELFFLEYNTPVVDFLFSKGWV